MYHLISDDNVIHIKHLYKIRSLKQFEEDLEFFVREFNILTVHDLRTDEQWGRIPEKGGFLLSFDDGLREFHDIVAPVLLKKGLSAICFLNTDFIDNKDLFYRYKASILVENLRKKKLHKQDILKIKAWCINNNLEWDEHGRFLLSIAYQDRAQLNELADLFSVDLREYLNIYKPYLTTTQITSLIKQGFVFGAHSIDHPYFQDISADQQIHQITRSMTEIDRKFQQDYRLFSFPFTDYGLSAGLFKTIFNAVQPVADLTFGCAGLKKDITERHIQRIPLESGTFSASEIISGEYLYFMFKALFNRNKISRI